MNLPLQRFAFVWADAVGYSNFYKKYIGWPELQLYKGGKNCFKSETLTYGLEIFLIIFYCKYHQLKNPFFYSQVSG